MIVKTILDAQEMQRTLERLIYEVLEKCYDQDLALIGIQRRGVDLAMRMQKTLQSKLEKQVDLGGLDINLYRDDWTSPKLAPSINSSEINFDVDGRDIILVDDVLFTGRTIRAALEAILDYGRPKSVRLLVLVDRGHRELPIHADFIGREVFTSRQERVDVYVQERDGEDRVVLKAAD